MSRVNNLIGSSGEIKGDEILTKGPSKYGRRHFLKLLTVAAAALYNTHCNDDTSHNDNPPPPAPVFELKYGPYDNFDGQGGHQDYDNIELAVAGALSSQLWRGRPDVVDNPSNLVAVVNENNQFVQYGWEDTQVQRIIQYLQENVRPVTYFEKEQFEKFLNPIGQDLVSRIEEKDIEKQHKILQYVLSNRTGFFNEKGLKLDKIMREKNAQNFLTYKTLNDVRKAGFKEDEIMALYSLQQEVDFYNGNLRRKLRAASKKGIDRVKTALGIETRIEPVEYKYTFDTKGDLVDAVPHSPGQPYHGSRQLRWIDGKGQVHATAQTVPGFYAQSASGNVVKMASEMQGAGRLELISPEAIEFQDYKSFSADVMMSAQSASEAYHISLDFHTSIPEQPPGASWFSQIGIIKDPTDGNAYIFAQISNVNKPEHQVWRNFGKAEYDQWYNFRMDIVTNKDENGADLKDDEVRVDWYVNGDLKDAIIPTDHKILSDPDRTEFGPKRSSELNNKDSGKNAVAFLDNFKGVYRNRVS